MRSCKSSRLLGALSMTLGLSCGVACNEAPPLFPTGQARQAATIPETTCTAAGLIVAITAANATPEPDIIELKDGCTYTLTAPDNYWYGPNGLPPITSDITIQPAQGGKNVVIERDPALPATSHFRLFYVAGPGIAPKQDGRLTLRNVTVRNGLAQGGNSASLTHSGGGGMGAGGAIFAHGQVLLDRVLIANNTAQGGSSGNVVASGTLDGTGGGGMGGNSTGGGGGGFRDAPAGDDGGSGVGNTEGGKVSGSGGTNALGTENGTDGTANKGGGGGGSRGLGGNGGGPGGANGVAGDGGGGGGDGDTFGGGGGGAGFGGNGGTGYDGLGGGGGFGGGGARYRGAGGVGGGGGGDTATSAGGGGGFGGGGGGSGGDDPTIGHGGFGGFGGGGGAAGLVAGGSRFQGGAGAVSLTDASGGGGSGFGGGVFIHEGTLTIVNSTLTANSAKGGNAGTATKRGGGGAGFGGAVFNLNGTINVINSTLAANAVAGGTGSTTGMAQGGALYNLGFGNPNVATGSIKNSILADSTGGNDLHVDGAASVVSSMTSIAEASGTSNSGTINGSPTAVDPKLGTLKDNGGPTRTLALTQGSPADDTGDLAVCQTTPVGGKDQSGSSRGSQKCDMGGLEFNPMVIIPMEPSPDLAVTLTPVRGEDERHYQITIGVQNLGQGPSGAAGISVTVPAGIKVLALSGEGWTCDTQVAPATCAHAGLAAAQQAPLVLSVELPYGLTMAGVTARASSQNADAVPANDSATAQLEGDPRVIQLAGGGFTCNAAGSGGGGGLPALGAMLLSLLLMRNRGRRSAGKP